MEVAVICCGPSIGVGNGISSGMAVGVAAGRFSDPAAEIVAMTGDTIIQSDGRYPRGVEIRVIADGPPIGMWYGIPPGMAAGVAARYID
jgi:hypothetical protein